MSRRRGATAAILLAALVQATIGAAALAAQQDPGMYDREARLMARLDSIRSRMESTPTRFRHTRLAVTPPPLDTTLIRGLRVVTPVEDTAVARRWVDDALRPVEARLGPIPTVPSPPTIRVDWSPTTVPLQLGVSWTRIQRLYSPGEVRRTLDSAIGEALARSVPLHVQAWLAGPLGPEVAPYRELAASPVPVVQDCVRGDTVACDVALGLRPADDAALAPALRLDPPPQSLGANHFAFVSADVRCSFLHYLLRTRPGTLERLMTWGDGPPEGARPSEGSRPSGGEGRGAGVGAILERAAGGPLEPVVAGWRDAVLAHPPSPLSAAVGTTALWILLFVALATRSTRWRAG